MPGFDAVLKFRCYQTLITRLARLARRQRRDLSDLYRIIMEDYVEAEEKRLGLEPITQAEMQEYLLAAERLGEAMPPHPAPRPVKYPPLRRGKK